MTNIGNTYEGSNGKFTGVWYKRNGEWFGGVWDRQDGKRVYGASVGTAWSAASVADDEARRAAGADAKMILHV